MGPVRIVLIQLPSIEVAHGFLFCPDYPTVKEHKVGKFKHNINGSRGSVMGINRDLSLLT